MIRALLHIIVAAIALGVAAYLVPGVEVTSPWAALTAAVVLSLLNIFVRPLLELLTLPITLVTLGLFSLIINAGIILLVDVMVAGFSVNGFWNALLFAIVLWCVNLVFAVGRD